MNYQEEIEKTEKQIAKLKLEGVELTLKITPTEKEIAKLQESMRPDLQRRNKISDELDDLRITLDILKNDAYFSPLKVGDKIFIQHEDYHKGKYNALLPDVAKDRMKKGEKVHEAEIVAIKEEKYFEAKVKGSNVYFFGTMFKQTLWSDSIGHLTIVFARGSPPEEKHLTCKE